MSYRFALALACALPLLAQVAPPVTRQDIVREVFHGVELVDPYKWLEDQDGAETRQWIATQNAYARSLLDRQLMRSPIARRLTEMLRHGHVGFPTLRGGYYFFQKRGADQ